MTANVEDNIEEDSKLAPWLGIAVFFVLSLWFLNWILVTHFIPNEISNRGAFGDMFGAVNALFSGLAFSGVIITIYLQTKELRLQREELRDTRQEIKGQKLQLARQADLASAQMFENSFYNILESLRLHVNGFSDSSSGYNFQGQECFKVYKDYLNNKLDEEKDQGDAYLLFYNKFNNEMSIYFRLLYNLIKFVDSSKNVPELKKTYVDIVRANLSDDEVFIIYYNCHHFNEGAKMLEFCTKYRLLKHMKTR